MKKENKLLQTIKDNDERFEKKIVYGITTWKQKLIDAFLCQLNNKKEAIDRYSNLKSHITQSRISELEVLADIVNEIQEVEPESNGRFNACNEMREVLEDTIKELRK